MRKPDPARFTGKRESKPDALEMKGFSASPPSRSATIIEKKPPEKKMYERTKERAYDRPDERTNVRKRKRVRIRHAFDIFEDQLRSLHTIQLEAVQASKRKPKLGEMVQQALDLYLKNR